MPSEESQQPNITNCITPFTQDSQRQSYDDGQHVIGSQGLAEEGEDDYKAIS